jgi:16S rRNA (guanine966-N2)-methyltransferase
VRIISGSHKGRRINPPSGLPVRPTTDFAKESIFNIIRNHFALENTQVLDLFSGTGSISYEFASRGCQEVIAVENEIRCVEFIKKVITEYRFSSIRVVKSNVFSFLNFCKQPFDIIFADPPYNSKGIETIPSLVFGHHLVKPDGWLILEHSADKSFIKLPEFLELRKYGKVHFSIFRYPEINPDKDLVDDKLN